MLDTNGIRREQCENLFVRDDRDGRRATGRNTTNNQHRATILHIHYLMYNIIFATAYENPILIS